MLELRSQVLHPLIVLALSLAFFRGLSVLGTLLVPAVEAMEAGIIAFVVSLLMILAIHILCLLLLKQVNHLIRATKWGLLPFVLFIALKAQELAQT